ncbi:GNAT family N-acetyltransferase [Ornithinimicrobium sp. Arc0846-15]|nr:GNAT family N-acetyltransferase [Ornithinimicrobium laminariae]
MSESPTTSPTLPDGWTSVEPTEADIPDLVTLLRLHEEEARGFPGADSENVAAEVTGRGARTHTHLLVRDDQGKARAWISCHDRAKGRVLVGITVDHHFDPELADMTAEFSFAKAKEYSIQIGAERGLEVTQMDSGAFKEDKRQARWLTETGFENVREWWQMSRPTEPGDENAVGTLREGVEIRRVERNDTDKLPTERDLRDVHYVLEESFADHFNSYRETFEEFLGRLREDPGHRWDHWWLATVDGKPAGAVVAAALTGRVDSAGNPKADASYVDYIGVHKRARGRGVAKALLNTVIADAAERGRGSVALEVDADSPTGADGLYTSMGWKTSYITQSWHKDVNVSAS